MSETKDLRDKLELEVGTADWQQLKPHFERGVIVIVENGLDIIDIALQIASNNTEQVQEWITSGAIIKPTLEQMELWELKELSFRSIVVAPFVLIQKINH